VWSPSLPLGWGKCASRPMRLAALVARLTRAALQAR
jgi:hypothetical protein